MIMIDTVVKLGGFIVTRLLLHLKERGEPCES